MGMNHRMVSIRANVVWSGYGGIQAMWLEELLVADMFGL